MLPYGHDGGHHPYPPKEQDTMGIDLDRHIVIDRAALPTLETEPARSGDGVVYVHSAGKCHSNIGADAAREAALEWLAIAEAIMQRGNAEKQRKTEIAAQFGLPEYPHPSKGYAGPMIDRIYELEQELNAAGGPL
jgi:hypothetical protein